MSTVASLFVLFGAFMAAVGAGTMVLSRGRRPNPLHLLGASLLAAGVVLVGAGWVVGL